jgi:hypothetical protein
MRTSMITGSAVRNLEPIEGRLAGSGTADGLEAGRRLDQLLADDEEVWLIVRRRHARRRIARLAGGRRGAAWLDADRRFGSNRVPPCDGAWP